MAMSFSLRLVLASSSLLVAVLGQTCEFAEEDYRIAFDVDCNDRAHFEIEHDLRFVPHSSKLNMSSTTMSPSAPRVWSGVGIGMGRGMRDIDFTQLNVDTARGTVSIVDMRVSGYTSPRADRIQDFTLDSYSLDGTVLKASFSRPIKTGDDNADLTMAHDLVLPYVGGRSSSIKSVGKHKRSPKIIKGVRVMDCKKCRPTKTVSQSLDGSCVEGVGIHADARWCGTYFNSIRGDMETKCRTMRTATRQLSRGCKFFRCRNCHN